MNKSIKGIWLYGQSGSGKSSISKKLAKIKKNAFIIDGDVVRKNISFDLGHQLKDRIISNKRAYGLAIICIDQKYFPVISSVYLAKKIATKLMKKKIRIIEVLREKRYLNRKLKNKKNIVGIHIKQPNLKSYKLKNDYNLKFDLEKILK